MVDWYRKKIDMVTERTHGLDASEMPRVLILGYPDYTYPVLKVRTGGSGDHPMLVNAGGINLAENVESPKGTVEVDPEWIMSQNPDVIIGMMLSSEGMTGYSSNETTINLMEQFRDKLLNDSAIKATKAGKDGKVFYLGDINQVSMQLERHLQISLILRSLPEHYEDYFISAGSISAAVIPLGELRNSQIHISFFFWSLDD